MVASNFTKTTMTRGEAERTLMEHYPHHPDAVKRFLDMMFYGTHEDTLIEVAVFLRAAFLHYEFE